MPVCRRKDKQGRAERACATGRTDGRLGRALTIRGCMRIIVTGGAGFIGSCFIRLAVQNGSFEIANVDKLTYAGNLENLASIADRPNYRFLKCDLCDREALRAVFEQVKPDAVVHFAAESHVDRSIFSP